MTAHPCAYVECRSPGVWCLQLPPLRAWVCDAHRQVLLDDLAKLGLVAKRQTSVRADPR